MDKDPQEQAPSHSTETEQAPTPQENPETPATQITESEPPVELKHKEVYEGEDWKALDPLDRAQILLVSEGVKNGSMVGADYTYSQKIFKKLGLVEEQTSEPGELGPVFMIASPEKMSKYQREILTVPEGLTDLQVQQEWWKIQGEALGYPTCCTEEYANPKKNLEARKAASEDPNHPISNYEYELKQKVASGGEVPEDLLYKPPTYTPCSVNCENAHAKLREWQKVMKAADPEAARELREFNIFNYEEMQRAFPEEFAEIKQQEEDTERLKDLRKSLE